MSKDLRFACFLRTIFSYIQRIWNKRWMWQYLRSNHCSGVWIFEGSLFWSFEVDLTASWKHDNIKRYNSSTDFCMVKCRVNYIKQWENGIPIACASFTGDLFCFVNKNSFLEKKDNSSYNNIVTRNIWKKCVSLIIPLESFVSKSLFYSVILLENSWYTGT